MKTIRNLLFISLILGVFPYIAYGFVMGIDLGGESFKVAVVRPRFEVALNDASSRKTPTLAALYQGELVIGTDAKSLVAKSPSSVFSRIHRLVGRAYGDPEITKEIDEGRFPFKLVEFRGRYGIQYDENLTLAVEDVLAFILSNAKQIGSKHAGTTIKDCAITVPPYYTQDQRQSLLDAAKIAGLNVLALITDTSAVALHWGIERQFDTDNSTYAIFYDMGAVKTSVSLAAFRAIPDSKKNKTSGQLTVLATAWDENLGGEEFDKTFVNYLVGQIKTQHKVDVTKDAKAMAKLYREAQKGKEVLSANSEVLISVEGLTSDIDFKHKITREQFENLVSSLFERAIAPIQRVLKESEVPLENVHYFEVVGGGIRIPKLQQKMKEFLKRDELDKHLNGDEAAVLGATFHAASQSSSFRAREFKLKELYPFDVDVSFQSDNKEVDKKTDLFKAGSRYNSKKSVTFFASENFTAALEYHATKNLPKRASTQLGSFYVTEFPSTERYNFTGKPKIHNQFRLNMNGIVVFDRAEAEITVTEVKKVPVKKIKSTTEKAEKTTEEAPTEESTEATTESTEESDQAEKEESAETTDNATESTETASESTEATTETTTETASETKTEEAATEKPEEVEYTEKVTTKVHRVTMKVTPVNVLGMTEADFTTSKKILADIQQRIEKKREKEREKNTLEAYIYEMRDKLETENVMKVTTEEQRTNLMNDLNAAGDWLYEEGADTTAEEYRSKYTPLKAAGDKIFRRFAEITARPDAVENVKVSINASKVFLENVTNMYEVTEQERDDILKSIDEFEKWVEDKVKEQEGKALHEDPAFTSDQLAKKWKAIEGKVRPLFYRKVKKVAKAEETTTTTTETTNESTTESTTDDSTNQETTTENAGDAEANQEAVNQAKEEL